VPDEVLSAQLATGDALLDIWRVQQRHEYLVAALQERCNAQEVALRELQQTLAPLQHEYQARQARTSRRPVYLVAVISAITSVCVTLLAWVLKK